LNYITEIKAFYDWLLTNPIPADAQALWHALMHINNKCGWKKTFSVANTTLMSMLGISITQLQRMRIILATNARITYQKRRGRSVGIYELIPFAIHNVQQPEQQVEQQPGQQPGQQTPFVEHNVHINKQYKHKQKLNIYTPEFESFFESYYLRQVGKVDAFKAWNARLKEGKTPEEMILAAKNYMAECKRKGTETQYVKHPKTFLGPGGHIDEWKKGGQANGHPNGDSGDPERDKWDGYDVDKDCGFWTEDDA
jgi:hypothetical protein